MLKRTLPVAWLVVLAAITGLSTAAGAASPVATAPGQEVTASDPAGEFAPRTLSDALSAARDRPIGVAAVCTRDITFISHEHNRLVYADFSNGDWAMLRAAGVFRGGSELFTVCTDNFNVTTFQNQANGLLVSAELGWSGDSHAMLRARHTWVGPWEQFRLEWCGDGCVAIRSLANHLYVSAEFGFSGGSWGMLRARNGWVGPWERFR